MRGPARSECISNGYGFCSIDLSPTTFTSPDSGTFGTVTTSEMQDVSGDPDWSSTLTAMMLGPGPEIPFPTTTSASASTSISTPAFTFTSGIPALSSLVISLVSKNAPSTSQQPSTVPSVSPSPPPPAPSAVSTAPGLSYEHSLPTPALAGAVVSAVLAVAVAAALVRCWVRRRRTRALLPRQNMAIVADHARRFTTARVGSKHQADSGVQDGGASTSSLGSARSRGALDGSAETLACSPSSSSRRTPTLTVDVDNKHRESSEPELPSHGPSPSLLPTLPRSPVAPEIEEIGGAPSHSERILRFELPWVLGQRVLAVIAREDARGESGVEEPLPAYEPHG
ncbi:uncharacterized protein TRAVEDRAFT_23112 [Trametes versicolor FP-101664 SS1]|uniref:uncharacterized protein n=1 Tax=Trametes versicolor (strain FP-101664) TaxID=717944 RepID=UPI00046217B8|nr:uncharacterized protein TRAVEDRAFT_23112 [Trametes versicolor FP-101664 SS1]EIW53820.1 hypothetical protein TRAVEDRAFT_23112 [Trametes versicolor FP-101664 SS1]